MLVSKDNLEEYVFGSLEFACIDWRRNPRAMERSLSVYRHVAARGHYHLPFFLIYDIYAIVSKGYEAAFRSDELEGDSSIHRRYEREIIGRLLQSHDIGAGIEVASTSGNAEQVRERMLMLLLDRLAPLYPDSVAINPAQLRDLIPPDLEGIEFGMEEFSFEESVTVFLGAVGDQIRWGKLLREEDFFELTHLDVLENDHLRVGCRQILQLDRKLVSPHSLRIDLANHESETETAFLDETHYPTGGLTGLTNRGSFESLVASELVYMEDATDGISLFDLRYVEGELLYYLRDSGVLRRKRRTIHLIIDLGAQFHVKSPRSEYQYSILSQGFCLRLLREFFDLFAFDSLRFRFHFLPTGNEESLQQEMSLLRLLLNDYVRHGWVDLQLSGGVNLDELIDERRKSYVVILGNENNSSSWSERLEIAKNSSVPIHTTHLTLDAEASSELLSLKEHALIELLS